MSLTWLQGNNVRNTALNTLSIAYPSNVTAGNLLVVGGASASSGILGVPTDTQGNTWHVILAGANLVGYWAVAKSSSANTVSWSYGTNSGMKEACIGEYTVSGLPPSIDGTGSNSTTGSSLTVTSSSAVGSSDLVVCYFADISNTGPGTPSGYTSEETTYGAVLADMTASGSGAQSATATTANGDTTLAWIANFNQAAVIDPCMMMGL